MRSTQPVIVDGRYIGDRYPGIGRYTYSLVAELARQSPRGSLTLLVDPDARNSRFDLTRLGDLGVETRPVPQRARTLRGYFAGRRAADPASVFHAPHVFSALPSRGASVMTIQDLIPLNRHHGPTAPRTRIVYPRLLRNALRSATVVLTPTRGVRDELRRRPGMASTRVEVTPYAADAGFRRVADDRVEALRSRLGLPALYVLCVATDRPHKNLRRLLCAWADLTPEQRQGRVLVVANALDGRRSAEPGAQSRDAGTMTCGPVDEADMPALYSGAELLVHPALLEGFGLPVAEAMACGVPVLCSDAHSLDTVCGDGALRFDATNEADLAAAMTRAIADVDLRERLAAASLAQARTLSWQKTAELTLAAYETARQLAGTSPTAV